VDSDLDKGLRELFDTVERYANPLLGRSMESTSFSAEENKVLALQNVNRLNIKIGKMARSKKDETGNLHLLQMYVNNLTVGIKNNNTQLMKSAIASARNIINEMNKSN
jgi:hypothetical protein